MIFVFGSNLAGIHGAGAARHAYDNLGAEWGIGEGMTGSCYALPTKNYKVETLSLKGIKVHMEKFLNFAGLFPDISFELTPIGTGFAGYTKEEITSMIIECGGLTPNIYLSSSWINDQQIL